MIRYLHPMNNPTLSPASAQAVALALRLVEESRPRMNTYSDSTRESLEVKAREFIKGGCQSKSHCKLN